MRSYCLAFYKTQPVTWGKSAPLHNLSSNHQALDKAVDACYRPQPFTSEA